MLPENFSVRACFLSALIIALSAAFSRKKALKTNHSLPAQYQTDMQKARRKWILECFIYLFFIVALNIGIIFSNFLLAPVKLTNYTAWRHSFNLCATVDLCDPAKTSTGVQRSSSPNGADSQYRFVLHTGCVRKYRLIIWGLLKNVTEYRCTAWLSGW